MKSCFFSTVGMLVMAVCMSSRGRGGGRADFREAMAALQSNDVSRGLHYLELAIADDPDNLRYASEYRQAIIRNKEFDRSISSLPSCSADHPNSANLHLNYGFAYVDKIPTAGSITQVILANTALDEFSKAVELRPTWIAFYTRGASYLFWPKIFNKAPLGVADLEKALAMQHQRTQEVLLRAHLYCLGGWLLQDGGDGQSSRRPGRRVFASFPTAATQGPSFVAWRRTHHVDRRTASTPTSASTQI